MKGATADPDVKTIRLPNRTTQIIIGRSQNFFRSLMKDQSSIKNSPMFYLRKVSSKLLAVGSWRLTVYCLLLTVYRLTVAALRLRSGHALRESPVSTRRFALCLLFTAYRFLLTAHWSLANQYCFVKCDGGRGVRGTR
jgi:hypothetical protein